MSECEAAGRGLGGQQQLDELLELLLVLVNVDLGLPERVDQHGVAHLVQHDVCPQLGVQSAQVKEEGSPQDSWPGWGKAMSLPRAGVRKAATSGQAREWGWGWG